MFEGFADQWTPLLPSRGVTGSLRRVVVAGTPLVTWRTPAGQAAVLYDRCPHRGASLALGSITDQGHLACGFHGWEFEADGRCAHVPFNPNVNLARLGATAPPTIETAGLVWVFTGSAPLGGPDYPDSLDDPAQARGMHVEEWKCHWTRAMESLLDSTHMPIVHGNTVGRRMKRRTRRDSIMRIPIVQEDWGFGFLDRIDDHPPGGEISWYRPNLMLLEANLAPREMRLYIWCVPIDENRTRIVQLSTRNFAKNKVTSYAVRQFNRLVFRQARAIVESSPPGPVPDPRQEQNVPTDRPMLMFRAWYQREMADSSVPDPGGRVRPPADD